MHLNVNDDSYCLRKKKGLSTESHELWSDTVPVCVSHVPGGGEPGQGTQAH